MLHSERALAEEFGVSKTYFTTNIAGTGLRGDVDSTGGKSQFGFQHQKLRSTVSIPEKNKKDRIMKYATPFVLKDRIIHDRNGKKVKLWGVNYYAPFNHNYYNIAELEKNHFAAIDEDIRHFKLMGIDFVRMHLYDREITDREGNIIENHNMEVFDYLVDRCEKNGIYLMLSPTVWWNTVKNEIFQERYYAYWFIDSQDAFGFSNYYSCDSMLWDPDAIRCQEIYIEALLTRKNRISGKTLSEYPNFVVIELFNEPRYPQKWLLDKWLESGDLALNPMDAATFSRGKQREKFIAMWREFCSCHPELTDEDACFSAFRAEIMQHYFERLFPLVEKYLGKQVIKAQFCSYSGLLENDLRKVFEKAGIQAYTIGTYLNVNGFDAVNTDAANHLDYAIKWFERFGQADFGPLAKISYEFDASATQNGYPLAAIAAMYAKYDIQMAACFTYTPAAVAAWNPGWLVHYLSLEHTPSKAAGFAAAGEIFRNHDPGDEIVQEADAWHGSDYAIERNNDFVYFKNAGIFRYSASNDLDLGDVSSLKLISGRGNSRLVSCDSNAFYHLEKINENSWLLELMSNQRYVTDPQRGKAYISMANRYVNCLKETPVSLLKEDKMRFRLRAFFIVRAENTREGHVTEANATGEVELNPGRYVLTVTKANHKMLPFGLHKNWQLFLNVISPEMFDAIPDLLESPSGEMISPRLITLNNNALDFAQLTGGKFRMRNTALLYNSFTCESSGIMMAGFSADWWMEIYINGNKIFSTMSNGNCSMNFFASDHIIEFPVRQGKNLLAVKVLSGSNGWKFVCG